MNCTVDLKSALHAEIQRVTREVCDKILEEETARVRLRLQEVMGAVTVLLARQLSDYSPTIEVVARIDSRALAARGVK